MIRIKNFVELKNLGKYVNPPQIAGKNFTAVTVLYGKNTLGKSTLTRIFKSLQFNDPDILLEKKTIGTSVVPVVKFKDESGGVYEFNGTTWTANVASLKIEVFDSLFVDENIYSGEKISDEHHEQLNKIILGKTGVAKQRRINELTAQINNATIEKTRLTREFANARTGFTIDELRRVQVQTSNLEERIKAQEILINQIKNIEAIAQSLNVIRTKIGFDFKYFREILEEKLTIDIGYIKSHISHASKEAGSLDFIRSGIAFQRSTAVGSFCVLCGQAIGQDAEKHFKTFQDFFTSRYQVVSKGIREIVRSLEAINLESNLILLQNKYEEYKLDSVITQEELARMSKGFDNLKDEAREKEKNLDADFDFKNFDIFEHDINNVISVIDNTISGLRTDRNIKVLENELRELKLEFLRVGPYAGVYRQYDELEKISNEASIERAQLMKLLDLEMDAHVASVLGSLNSYLTSLRAGFSISRLEHKKKIRAADKSLYSIEFNGVDVPLRKLKGQPYFSNVLSDSDKRVLALAFFMATARSSDAEIIIFDDPVNSLDNERKRAITLNIGELAALGKQVIILTHDVGFLREINWEPNLNNQFMVITNDGVTSNLDNSQDIRDYLEDNHKARIKRLCCMQASGRFDSNFEAECRKLMEHIFELKHHDSLAAVSNKSITGYAEIVFAGSTRKITEFKRLGNYLHVPLHDGSIPEVGNADNQTTMSEFFKCLSYI